MEALVSHWEVFRVEGSFLVLILWSFADCVVIERDLESSLVCWLL